MDLKVLLLLFVLTGCDSPNLSPWQSVYLTCVGSFIHSDQLILGETPNTISIHIITTPIRSSLIFSDNISLFNNNPNGNVYEQIGEVHFCSTETSESYLVSDNEMSFSNADCSTGNLSTGHRKMSGYLDKISGDLTINKWSILSKSTDHPYVTGSYSCKHTKPLIGN